MVSIYRVSISRSRTAAEEPVRRRQLLRLPRHVSEVALSYDASTTEELALRRQGSLMRASIPPAAAIGIVPDKTQQCRAAHLLHDRDPRCALIAPTTA